MPELPEVEIARRQLARWAAGRRVRGIRLEDPGAVRTRLSTTLADAHPEAREAVTDGVVGAIASEPIRAGKRLGWAFGDGGGWLVHLGMSGQWVKRAPDAALPPHARLGVELEDAVCWFCDLRRFGCIVPVGRDALEGALREGLGPDALDAALGAEGLRARLTGRRAIKTALLDQAVIAGVGNIQAIEALWRAGVHPATRCDRLSDGQVAALAEAIPAQLAETIASEDTDEMHYLTQGGDNPFDVYGRAGEPCRRCGATLVDGRLGGRATVWCPACQPDRG